jgi:hypothetical protein
VLIVFTPLTPVATHDDPRVALKCLPSAKYFLDKKGAEQYTYFDYLEWKKPTC